MIFSSGLFAAFVALTVAGQQRLSPPTAQFPTSFSIYDFGFSIGPESKIGNLKISNEVVWRWLRKSLFPLHPSAVANTCSDCLLV